MRRIRVLIADDSLFVRMALRRLLAADPELEVVGEAADGLQAVEQVLQLRPDVCTMDLNMPGLDGVGAVREIMRLCPTPVVMLSAYTADGSHQTLEALGAGAVDFLAKPSGEVSVGMAELGVRLRDKLRMAAGVRTQLPLGPRTTPLPNLPRPPGQVWVVALSTGGPQLLSWLLPQLPPDCKPLLIVQHMPAEFTRALAERLARLCQVEVREAAPGDRPARGRVLIAPGGWHLLVCPDGTLALDRGPKRHGVRPAADVTMESAALCYRSRAAGLVLTGMGEDGTAGLRAIRAAGGVTLAQDPASCLVGGMPRAALEAGVVDRLVHPQDLLEVLR
ncbi:MAG: chemotaxis response regulator protein-glutamate methylesterase [Myxococcales bacterium]|nr:chemotaxis response regulator protein-glutamate methylesterase [Myxococcota bacterium]MDW8282705.1 chemotaxis response regulator protein-glutamate methylesterase [Myxococcales bacterium]